MANYTSANVIFVDTSAAFPQAKRIDSIRYVGANTSSVTIRGNASASGPILFTDATTTTNWYPEMEIRDGDGVYVAVTGTASAYIYLCE